MRARRERRRYAHRRHRSAGRDVRPGARHRPRRPCRAGRPGRRQPGPDAAPTTTGWRELGAGAGARRTPPTDFAAMLAEERVDVVLVTTVDRDPRRVHRGRARRRLRRDHREADDDRRAAAAGGSSTRSPQTGRQRARSPSTTATTRCTSRSASCSPAARSARSARCTSSGCSTCGTAPTTSGAGTATRPTPAACWCTRRATTSTWSTGGSAPRPVEVYAARAGCSSTARPARRHGYARDYERAHGAPAAAGDPFALHLADNPRLRALYLDAEARRRLPARPQRLRARRDDRGRHGGAGRATPPAPR